MPMYDIRCEVCGDGKTIFRRIAEYNNLPQCLCGGKMARQISAPAVQVDLTPFVSPATGRVINSKAALREDLSRSGCFLPEPGIDRDVKRWGEESREKAFKPIEKGVDSVVSQLVATGKIES